MAWVMELVGRVYQVEATAWANSRHKMDVGEKDVIQAGLGTERKAKEASKVQTTRSLVC